MLHGVDVSAYQPSYDTDGLDFVIVKSTEGRTYVNPRMDAQVKRARDAECVVGFYHFLWPGDVTDQVAYFLAKTPEKAGDLPRSSSTATTSWANSSVLYGVSGLSLCPVPR
ncbi:hypothetical protein SFIMM107S_04846 [Streptomyces griseus]